MPYRQSMPSARKPGRTALSLQNCSKPGGAQSHLHHRKKPGLHNTSSSSLPIHRSDDQPQAAHKKVKSGKVIGTEPLIQKDIERKLSVFVRSLQKRLPGLRAGLSPSKMLRWSWEVEAHVSRNTQQKPGPQSPLAETSNHQSKIQHRSVRRKR